MAEQEMEEEIWNPKTKLGRKVAKDQITDIVEALRDDRKIMEPELVDQLVDLDEEVVLIGGTPGKGGGKSRTVSKRTVRMHKSGARYNSGHRHRNGRVRGHKSRYRRRKQECKA
jgi:putative protein kinase ArgK-like GTPase of G3E family